MVSEARGRSRRSVRPGGALPSALHLHSISGLCSRDDGLWPGLGLQERPAGRTYLREENRAIIERVLAIQQSDHRVVALVPCCGADTI